MFYASIHTRLLENFMNAAKRFLTGTAVTIGALGIGAGAERRPSDAKYDDGNYDFYKNGAHVEGDCDGYNSEPGEKTTIYEYYQSEINKWEKRLLAAGVKPDVYRTSKPKHCWGRFDTDLLNGIGYTGRDWANETDGGYDL
jgi:hypothetical protein